MKGQHAPPPRRPEFDAIVQGWGADQLDALDARWDLVQEWLAGPGGGRFSVAEGKILKAMDERRKKLCGDIIRAELGYVQ